jgi:uncharacterized protein
MIGIGGLAGLAGGLLGVGGGFLMVPLQMLWTATPPRRAAGNSLAAIVPIAVVAAAIYYFGGGRPQLDLTVALWVMIGSSAGSLVGSALAPMAPDRVLRILMIALLLAGAAKEAHDALVVGAVQGGGPNTFDVLHSILLAVAGFAIGCISGLTGVGGGILLVPTLVLAFGVGQRIAQGTSLVAILPTAAIGAAVHQRHKDLEPSAATRLALGGVPASVVGALLAQWLPQRVLAGLFGVLLLAMAVRLWGARTPEAGA